MSRLRTCGLLCINLESAARLVAPRDELCYLQLITSCRLVTQHSVAALSTCQIDLTKNYYFSFLALFVIGGMNGIESVGSRSWPLTGLKG
jgi:hypothetical protein